MENYDVTVPVQLVLKSIIHDKNGKKCAPTSKKFIFETNNVDTDKINKGGYAVIEYGHIVDSFLNGSPCLCEELGSVNGGKRSKQLHKNIVNKVSEETKDKFVNMMCSMKVSSSAYQKSPKSMILVYENSSNGDFDFDSAISNMCDYIEIFYTNPDSLNENDRSILAEIFNTMWPSEAHPYWCFDNQVKKTHIKVSTEANLMLKFDKFLKECYDCGKEISDLGDIRLSTDVCNRIKDLMDVIKKETILAHEKQIETFRLI